MTRVLELFKGSGSVGSICIERGYEVISLDIDGAFNPDIVSDIMDWDYTMYPHGHFDIVWASPPCTYYSCCQRMRKRDLTEELIASDKIVQRVLDIIKYYEPKYWFIENPETGSLKSRNVMSDISFVDADYCKYGYPYRKRTRFWTNRGVKLELCRWDCPVSDIGKNKHLSAIGGNRNKYDFTMNELCQLMGMNYNLQMRYSIPKPLLRVLLPHILTPRKKK